jgi:uncharacterized protein (TIGR03086 family)
MDTTHPERTSQRYRRADLALDHVLATVEPQRWDAPSPCEGWSARDVVGHLIETQRAFLLPHGADLGPDPDLADPAAAWRRHAARVVTALADGRLAAVAYDGHFGPTTVGDTLERFYVFDMVAHRWDVAGAAGVDDRFTDAELDELEAGIASFGDAIHMEGVCAPAVPVPEGADRQTRILASMGRAVAS